ncbi:hypothetical protein P43SY_005287 [Pythium insidiosum]|uniref:FYVE-type domain-containing protein n=1 Tax=Pythium insidiosum TaxID=114742 RepID=A0AAD5Q9J5_PYTIN|nr:hypothetical protein P43SY_005287 [Pythium insidiosum]
MLSPKAYTSSSDIRVTAVFTGKSVTTPSAYGGIMGYSDDDDDDDVSDDPAWYHAPRESLQPALPLAVLMKKESVGSMKSSASTTASSDSSNPASPQSVTSSSKNSPTNATRAFQENGPVVSAPATPEKSDNQDDAAHDSLGEDNDVEDDEDYFPPEPVVRPSQSLRGSRVSVPVQMRAKSSTKGDIKRVSLQRASSDQIKPSAERNSNMMKRQSSFDMSRTSMDMRSSMDFGGVARDSMMKYRPSDLSAQELNSTLTRDSLAALADMNASSRPSQFMRQSDAELPDLLRAAKTGNIMLLKACLQDRTTDITMRDSVHGQTAMHFAVRHGQFAAVRLLCQKKYGKQLVDAIDARHNTPLHLAAARSRRITKFLLENGAADVTKINARGLTPLGVHLITAKRDDPLIAEILLAHKADANALVDKTTLLHKAVDLKLLEIAGRLVRYGARLDVKDDNGKMVFDKVNRKVLRQLLGKISYPPVWVPDEEREHCMLCSRKFSKFFIGVRRHHCRHCGRICCGQCSHVSVECVEFPKTFEDRLEKGGAASNKKKKRVCKTCSSVFKERQRPQEEKKIMSDFMSKVVGCEWEEMPGQQNAPRASLAS